MPYVTSIERLAREEGKREGKREAKREGKRDGLLDGIATGLELKFGSEGLACLSEIHKIGDVELLRSILQGIKTTLTVAKLRTRWK